MYSIRFAAVRPIQVVQQQPSAGLFSPLRSTGPIVCEDGLALSAARSACERGWHRWGRRQNASPPSQDIGVAAPATEPWPDRVSSKHGGRCASRSAAGQLIVFGQSRRAGPPSRQRPSRRFIEAEQGCLATARRRVEHVCISVWQRRGDGDVGASRAQG